MPDNGPAPDPALAPEPGVCRYATYVGGPPGAAAAARRRYGVKRPAPAAPDAFPDVLASADCPPLWQVVYVRGRLAYQGPGPCPPELLTAGDGPPPPLPENP